MDGHETVEGQPGFAPDQPTAVATPAPSPAPVGEGSPTPESTLVENIRKAGARVFNAATAPFKKGRGRPRKDGQPGKADLVFSDAGEFPTEHENLVGGEGEPGIDESLVKRCVSAVVKASTGVLNTTLYRKAVARTNDHKFAQTLCKQCEIEPAELDALSELSAICLKKYGVGSEYAPEIGLGCIVAGIGVRYAAAFSQLNNYEPEPQPA